jgi:hypothetical protein
LTSKQRVLTACRHQEPDRVPIQVYLTPEIHGQLQAHFGDRDLFQALGVDFRGVGAPYRGEMRPGPGMPGKADFYDEFGVGYSRAEYASGAYYEASELALAPLATLEDVERYPWPSAADYDYGGLADACDALADYAVCLGGLASPTSSTASRAPGGWSR